MSQYQLRKQVAALWVTRNWIGILVFWIAAAVLLKWMAPTWESVTKDGDLQFLPASLPSRVGERLLEEAFPGQQSKSRMVLIVARENGVLKNEDLAVAFDLGRRLTSYAAANIFEEAKRTELNAVRLASLGMAKGLLDISIEMDSNWFEAVTAVAPENGALLQHRWMPAFLLRAQTLEMLKETAVGTVAPDDELWNLETIDEQISADRKAANLIQEMQSNKDWGAPLTKESLQAWKAISDVWTWADPLLGNKLGANHPSGRMIALQLSNEFMAVGNVALVKALESLVNDVRELHKSIDSQELAVGISGPAAIGADMLRAASSSVQQTESISILMVLGILVLIYRAPLLVLIPLGTILLSLSVATSVISLLVVRDPVLQSILPGLKVFSTTRIFLVVLLFGIGADFCLFLISRCREELKQKASSSKAITNRKGFHKVVAVGWVGVFDALMGSAFTTSLGLAMMYFSAFEKFRYNGIVIAIAILITLAISLTFTPALLCAFGKVAFWPTRFHATPSRKDSSPGAGRAYSQPNSDGFWGWLSRKIIYAPVATLAFAVAILCVPAYEGWMNGRKVTYDFLTELNESAPSRQGANLIERFFTTRDNSPITLVLVADKAFSDNEELSKAIERLGNKLYLEGVTSVRSMTDPLGDYPPDKRMGLFDQNAWRRRLLKNHRITTIFYVSKQQDQQYKTARMDLLLAPNPFSAEAENVLSTIRTTIASEVSDIESPWYRARFGYTGITAGIADLKLVTQADQSRIQWFVTIGVGLILFAMLRRPWLSVYLMLTVLLSYLSTLGLTQWVFAWLYGADYVGLDWKVPLLLFVILVAVGQDYNVYLVTRVLEEQAKHGMVEGLYRGMLATGSIITSCGIVMAATFLSMTMAGIVPWFSVNVLGIVHESTHQPLLLRGILELGFALGLGVLIDTFLVRSILVPAMMSWMIRFQKQ